MDTKTSQLLGYPQEPTPAQISSLQQLNEISGEVSQRLSRIAQLPNVDRQWLSIGQQQVAQGLMALRQAVVPSESFNISQVGQIGSGTTTSTPRAL